MMDRDGEAVDAFDVLDVGEVEWHMLPRPVTGMGGRPFLPEPQDDDA